MASTTSFRGNYEHTIDAKGRISVPSKFREVLAQIRHESGAEEPSAEAEESVVITNFVQNEVRCLDVYPMISWERLEELLKSKQRIDPEALRFRNFYLGRACECQVDKQGRILIPPQLRNWAGLKRDVVFVPDLDRFQIWDKAVWEKYSTNTESEISQNPGKLSNIGV